MIYQFETIGQLIAEVQKQGFTVSRPEWTQEPPTEPGRYWRWFTDDVEPVEVIETREGLKCGLSLIKDHHSQWWWQKMSVPNPPEGGCHENQSCNH